MAIARFQKPTSMPDNSSSSNNNGAGGGGAPSTQQTPIRPTTPTTRRYMRRIRNQKGTFFGVFTPITIVLLSSLSLLRLPSIVESIGFVGSIFMFFFIFMLTSSFCLQLSTIATNSPLNYDYSNWGPYYLLSRTMGAEMGGVSGITYVLALTFATSQTIFDVVTYAFDLFQLELGAWNHVGVVLFSSTVLLLSALLSRLGSNMISNTVITTGMLLFACSLMNFVAFLWQPDSANTIEGYIPWNTSTFMKNALPSTYDFTTISKTFSTIFSSTTGVIAATSIFSVQLQNPNRSIPTGTTFATMFSFTFFNALSFLISGTTSRVESNSTPNSYSHLLSKIVYSPKLLSLTIFVSSTFIILLYMITATKILQDMYRDQSLKILKRLLKWLPFHDEEDEENDELFQSKEGSENARSSGLSFSFLFVTVLIVEFATLFLSRFLTTAITIFTLFTYAIISFTLYYLTIKRPLNFRPTLHSSPPKKIALASFCIYLLLAYCIHPLFAFITTLCLIIIAFSINLFSPNSHAWSDTTHMTTYHHLSKYRNAITTQSEEPLLSPLSLPPTEPPSWRPQILFLCRNPGNSYNLLKFLNDITHTKSLYYLGYVICGAFETHLEQLQRQTRSWNRFVQLCRLNAFFNATIAETTRAGLQNLLSLVGIGRLQPNLIVLSHYNIQKWIGRPLEPEITRVQDISVEVLDDPLLSDLPSRNDIFDQLRPEEYVGMIEDTLQSGKSIMISRNFDKLELHPGIERKPTRVERIRSSVYRRVSRLVFGAERASSGFPGFRSQGHLSSFFTPNPLTATFDGRGFYDRVESGNRYGDDDSEYDDNEETGYREEYDDEERVDEKFIDIWPIQIAESMSPLLQHHRETIHTTTSLALQIGAIIHMTKYWRRNYSLRIIVFVEDEHDAPEEKTRVQMLLDSMRIRAVIKTVYLRSLDGMYGSDLYQQMVANLQERKQGRYNAIPAPLQRLAQMGNVQVEVDWNDEAEENRTLRDTSYDSLDPRNLELESNYDDAQNDTSSSPRTEESYVTAPDGIRNSGQSLESLRMYHAEENFPTSYSSSMFDMSIADSDETTTSRPPSFPQQQNASTTPPEQHQHQQQAQNSNTRPRINTSPPTPDPIQVLGAYPHTPTFSTTASTSFSIFNNLPSRTQHEILNELFRVHSSEKTTALMVVTLPAPDRDASKSREQSFYYLKDVDILTGHTIPTLLVHGKEV